MKKDFERATPITIRVCPWCEKEFIVLKRRKYNAVKYCCPLHKYYARCEQQKEYLRQYRRRYADVLSTDQLLGVGTEGLGPHRETDFKEEYKKVKEELRRRGL